MARVLWLTDEPPDRRLGGGSIRQSHLFRALAREMATDLLSVGRVEDSEVRASAAEVVELPVRRMPYTGHPIGRRVVDLAVLVGSRYPTKTYGATGHRHALSVALRPRERNYDLVCVEHEALAPLLPARPQTKWMLTFHHVLSGMIREELRMAPARRQRWFRTRDLAKAQRLERWAVRSYDRCVVCSAEDRERLKALTGTGLDDRLTVIPNGVDLASLRPTPVPKQPTILLPGTLAWAPNVDGAVWLCREIWPTVRAAVPEATLILAGRSPAAEVMALGRLPGVSVHGDVPSMTPYFEAARVVVVPLRIGTGTRIKALEAMAAARPIVGTTIGLEGVGIESGVHARVEDQSESFAKAIVELLRDDRSARTLGEAARNHAEQRFGWDRIGRQFVELVLTVIEGHPAPASALRSSSNFA